MKLAKNLERLGTESAFKILADAKKSSVLKITFEPSLGSAKLIILPLINFFILFIDIFFLKSKKLFLRRQHTSSSIPKVDLLIFIECPSQRSNNKIVIWCYPQNKRNWQSTITKDGREMYYLNKDDGIKLSYIDDVHIVNEMISFSNSTWQERA